MNLCQENFVRDFSNFALVPPFSSKPTKRATEKKLRIKMTTSDLPEEEKCHEK